MYLIRNKSGANNHLMIIGSPDTTFVNNGPEAAVVVDDEKHTTKLCLSPEFPIPETAHKNANFEIGEGGEFVIEIDGELIPMRFTEEGLLDYFKADNPNAKGVEITLDNNLT